MVMKGIKDEGVEIGDTVLLGSDVCDVIGIKDGELIVHISRPIAIDAHHYMRRDNRNGHWVLVSMDDGAEVGRWMAAPTKEQVSDAIESDV